MTQAQFQLKGWPAVAAIVAVLAFVGFKVFLVHSTLGPKQLEDVKLWLQADYVGANIDELRDATMSGDEAKIEALAAEVLATEKIEFVSVKARGTDEVVVRVEIEVDGRDPPDGKKVRYFLLQHRMGQAWRVKWETTSWSYYLKLF